MEKKEFQDLFDLTNKTAIVTGGAGIIGSRVCRGLAAFGANVAIFDVDATAAQETATTVAETYNTKTLSLVCDVSDKAQVREAVEETVQKLGGVHVLHNNAAGKTADVRDFFSPVEDFKFDVWKEVMEVNLDGMFLMAQAVGKQMIMQGGGGSIIQTASTYGIVAPCPHIYEGSEYLGHRINTPPVYSASKAGVVGLTKYLAAYWGPYDIRVNTLVPGGINSGQNETFQKNYGNRTPLGRMAERDEMVGALVYMASDASRYMTGQMMIVDGGWTAW